MQRLLASARALASDGSSASITEPLHEAEEDQAATIRNFFVKADLAKQSQPFIVDAEQAYWLCLPLRICKRLIHHFIISAHEHLDSSYSLPAS